MSIYDPMSKEKIKMMEEEKELLKDMLDMAILELEDNEEICLIDHKKVCKDYESIFRYLKHQALKRK